MSNRALELLNEKLKGWLLGGKVAVFLDDERVSEWVDLRDDMTAGWIYVTKSGPRARFRVLDGNGEFYAWIYVFPKPDEWIHEGEAINFPGLEFA